MLLGTGLTLIYRPAASKIIQQRNYAEKNVDLLSNTPHERKIVFLSVPSLSV